MPFWCGRPGGGSAQPSIPRQRSQGSRERDHKAGARHPGSHSGRGRLHSCVSGVAQRRERNHCASRHPPCDRRGADRIRPRRNDVRPRDRGCRTGCDRHVQGIGRGISAGRTRVSQVLRQVAAGRARRRHVAGTRSRCLPVPRLCSTCACTTSPLAPLRRAHI